MYRQYKGGGPSPSPSLDEAPPTSLPNPAPEKMPLDIPMHHGTYGQGKKGGLVKNFIREKTDSQDHLTGVDKMVSDSWKVIEKQCVIQTAINRGQKNDGRGWKTIRVFVSSTFTDYHSEREILVKKVFPALREWCEERRLSLVECDLRWGVPKDTDTKGTIEACMEELDRCHEETDGEPFFMNMISERYGWIPSLEELPKELIQRYDWVPNISITAMEIMHGAFRSRNRNAIFFLRKPDYVKHIPEKHLVRFVDDDPLAKAHLLALKKKLVERFPSDQVHEYSVAYDGVDDKSGREKVLLSELEKFADKTLEFFKEVISEKHPRHQVVSNPARKHNDDPLLQEAELQNYIMETKAQKIVGREKELSLLLAYAKGEDVDLPILKDNESNDDSAEKSLDRLLDLYGVDKDKTPTLCVTADTGVGKSTILAKLADQAKKEGLEVLYHAIGISADSAGVHTVSHKMVSALLENSETRLEKVNLPSLSPLLKEAFAECEKRDKQYLLIFDGLNEMLNANGMDHLAWLPPRVPGKVRCVVGANSEHFITMSRLRDHQPLHLILPQVDYNTREQIVSIFFEDFNKRLDPDQMKALISQEAAAVPLWLRTACEELRVFGDFRTLTPKIESLPGTLAGLLEHILTRLVHEDDTGTMEKLLCLLYCSPNGLAEGEMRGLLGDLQKKEEAPLVTWVTLRRYVKPFLTSVVYWLDGSLRVHLFHKAMKEAVKGKFIPDEATEIKWHMHLADYYQYHSPNDYNCREALPYHLEKADQGKRLFEFYRKDRRRLTSNHFTIFASVTKWRCRSMAPPGGKEDLSVWMCSLCANKSHLVSPSGVPTRQCCHLCGQVTLRRSPDTLARTCHKHKKLNPVPGDHKCHFCAMMFKKDFPPHGPGEQLHLCHMCAHQAGFNRCVHLEI